MRNVRIAIAMSVIGALLAACATQPSPNTFDPPGFWFGLLQGAIAPFALVGSLFKEVRIYAFPNGGWWYDLGFLLGVAIPIGSSVKSGLQSDVASIELLMSDRVNEARRSLIEKGDEVDRLKAGLGNAECEIDRLRTLLDETKAEVAQLSEELEEAQEESAQQDDVLQAVAEESARQSELLDRIRNCYDFDEVTDLLAR